MFLRVLGWALLAYGVIAGILEYVFVYDHTPGRELALFSAMLVLFALDVPLMLVVLGRPLAAARRRVAAGSRDAVRGPARW